MPIYPDAVFKKVPRWRTRMTPVRINYHTAVSNASSLHSFFNVAGRPTSHFYIREDGTVEQYVDTSYRAAADLQGNADTISIETWDGYPVVWKSGHPPAWSDAMLASLVKLTVWILKNHPTIPTKLATDSRKGVTSHGLSWHRLGVDGNFPSGLLQGRVSGGLRYSNARGKVCPGDHRIRQIPGILAAVKGEAPLPSGGGGKTKPKPATPTKPKAASKKYPEIPLVVDGVWGPRTTEALQRVLPRKYNGGKELLHDGVFGPTTKKAAQRWLKDLGHYSGRIDGVWGTLSEKALQSFLYDKGLYRNGSYSKATLVDGRFGTRSKKALQVYLNSQAKYL